MNIQSLNVFYKAFATLVCLTLPLQALTPDQKTNGCSVEQRVKQWLGIFRSPAQYTPKELMAFLASHTDWPDHDRLCAKAEEVIGERATTPEILAWFGKHPPQTPQGALAYGKALLARNEKANAAKVVRKAWTTLDLSREDEKKFLNYFKSLLRASDHEARLAFLLMSEDTDRAKSFLKHLSGGARKMAEVRLAFLMDASGALSKMKALPATAQTAEGVLYEKAKWCRKQKDFKTAAMILAKTPSNKAYAVQWWRERSYIARELIALGEHALAYKVLQHHQLQPGIEQFAEAEWLAGWVALSFLKQPKVAKRHFDVLAVNTKGAVSQARAHYWIGRTHEQQKELALAEKAYRKAAKFKTIFYGQLAAAKVHEKPHPVLVKACKVTTAEKARFNQKALVRAAYVLKKLGKGARDDLRKFLIHIAGQAKTAGERGLAVQLAQSLSPHDVVWAAKKAGHGDPVLLRAAYPTHTIPKKGKGQKIPEHALVMAVAYQESRFDPTAVSSAGAMGLLQVLPTTAAKEAKRLGVVHTTKKLFDPRHNLLLGTTHLSKLLKDFDNSYVLALAAYNAGPTPVKRWLEEFGDPRGGEVDIIHWIECIPYHETRNYVMRVLENATNYRSLQGPVKTTLIEDLTRGGAAK